MKTRNDCEIACDCVKRANVVLHVDLCKEIFARKHTATHKPTSAQPVHMCHDDTHTHTHTHTHIHTPNNRLWSPLAYGLGGNKLLLTRPPPLDSCLFPFASTLSGRSMQKPHQLILPEAHTSKYINSFFYWSSLVSNTLPAAVLNVTCNQTFKKEIGQCTCTPPNSIQFAKPPRSQHILPFYHPILLSAFSSSSSIFFSFLHHSSLIFLHS